MYLQDVRDLELFITEECTKAAIVQQIINGLEHTIDDQILGIQLVDSTVQFIQHLISTTHLCQGN